MDVDGIKILMPLYLFNKYGKEGISANKRRYSNFYYEIFARAKRIVFGAGEGGHLGRYKKIARAMAEMILPYVGVPVKLETLSFHEWNLTEFNTSLQYLSKYHTVKPVEYDEKDSHGIVKTLSSCEKVALIDLKENIKATTSYLNDNEDKRTYVRVDGDTFFSVTRGWTFNPDRGRYIEKRIKVLMWSGIFKRWEIIYNLWRPKRLLHEYANWTHPRIDAVVKLDFNSKISPGFYICGVCLMICGLVLFTEILRFKYTLKFKYVIYIVKKCVAKP